MYKHIVWIGAVLALGFSSASWAATFNFNYNLNTNGSTTTVATLDIVQDGTDVDFTLSNINLDFVGSGSFSTQLLFSSTQPVSKSDFTDTGPQTISNFNAGDITNAAYTFNLEVLYPTSSKDDRFVQGDVSNWTIADANVSDFTNLISGSGIDAVAMIHIQGTGFNGYDSLKYVAPVPEPEIYVMMMAGMAMVGFVGRRRRNKKA